ncbi:MAG: hypothetical protein AAFN77_21215 [Planctomycetota bacterium]
MNNVEKLFDRYVDGLLTSEELADLEDWIASDPSHAKQFLEWSATHLDLGVALRSDALREAVSQSRVPQLTQPENVSGSAQPQNVLGSAVGYLIVSGVAVILTIGILSLIRPWSSGGQTNVAETETKNGVIARVVQRIDCVIENEKWGASSATHFEAGQSVLISEGLAIIEFDRGARVILEGPADLEIVSDNSGFLRSGKLTANVPESAIGFEIVTPNSRVVDHGTEFGISVDANGDSETHVFDGEVELFADLNQATSPTEIESKSLHLVEREAARVTNGVFHETEHFPASPREFIRVASLEVDEENDSVTVSDLPQRDRLAMWFEASQGVQLDADSRIVSWQNLASAYQPKSTNQSSFETSAAWQVNSQRRPRWDKDGFANRPAIEFGGFESNEFLATSPIKTGPDTTVLVVCSFGRVSGLGYGHILSLGGRGKLIMVRSKPQLPGVFSWSFDHEQTPKFRLRSLEVKAEIAEETPMIGAIRYSSNSNIFQFYQNGKLVAEGDPVGSLVGNESHIIGCGNERNRFFFKGRVAEIVVYDHMLDQQSFSQASSALMKKYGIEFN